jgi:hypothetical protein
MSSELIVFAAICERRNKYNQPLQGCPIGGMALANRKRYSQGFTPGNMRESNIAPQVRQIGANRQNGVEKPRRRPFGYCIERRRGLKIT